MKGITPENYAEKRALLAEANQNLIGIVLKEEEKRADAVLQRLKREFIESCEGEVPYDIPVLTDPRIRESQLYRFCKELPKGADLHVHGTSLLPAGKIIDFAMEQESLLLDTETLMLVNGWDRERVNSRCLPLKEALCEGRVSREQLEREWTVAGIREEENAWARFENLFSYFDALDRDFDISRAYYIKAFEHYLENNILHAEIHILLSEDWEETDRILRTVRDAYYAVKQQAPDFVVSVIGCAMKMFNTASHENMRSCFLNTLHAQQSIRDESDPGSPQNFVLGLDLVNEEDASRPLKDYAELLLDFRQRYPDFEFFLHCGESNQAASDNLLDAYLLGASRVGHGLNLYRYPDLLRRYAEEEICLECCPVSNRTLRYVSDLRTHPGAEYLKRGVTLALCSDDPIFQEYEALTDDFFAAVLCWDLGLAEVKQLCLNSLTYSGLQEEQKKKLLRAWHRQWKEFVAEAAAR